MSLAPLIKLPPRPTTTRGEGIHLGFDYKNKDKICYASRAGIVTRSVTDPTQSDIYTTVDGGHHGLSSATVAKFSPSGYYIASGDKTGFLKVFSSKRNEDGDYIKKAEYQVLSGPIRDIAWSPDNQRLLVVGEGKDSFTRAFIMDTGASCGELGSHSAGVMSVDMKQSRPFRAVTGGMDFFQCFYTGPPFKFGKANRDFEHYVNCVRYNPAGDKYMAVSSDKKGVFYDGKTGEKVGELPAPIHKGTVYSCSWSPDGNQVLTSSADKTAKVWDVEGSKEVESFAFAGPEGAEIKHMQVAALWTETAMLTVGLNGDVNFLAPGTGAVSKVYTAHSNIIRGMALNKANGDLVAADASGNLLAWQAEAGMAKATESKKHFPKSITAMGTFESGVTVVGTGDKKVMFVDMNADMPLFDAPVTLSATCKAICCSAAGFAYCVTNSEIAVMKDGAVVGSVKFADATCAGLSPDGSCLVVGDEKMKLAVFAVAGDKLEQKAELSDHAAVPNAIGWSPCGTMMATGDTRGAGGNIIVWDMTGDAPVLKSSGWVFHTSRVTALAFSADSSMLISASTDCSVIVHKVDGSKRMTYANIHEDGVMDMCWLNADTLATGGNSGCIRLWKFAA